ncbi:MAG TPA: potassium-transporting ATPase subunit B, partial [Rhodoglobus sp.]|nr:potassium-transporting ATPase subunit B [Rhodoglobus sp.]
MNIYLTALPGAFRKLDPRLMWRNPVMFVVEVGALLTTALAIAQPLVGVEDIAPNFTVGIAAWLWVTVIFANLAESVAEGRGKAQAASLRQTRTSTTAHVVAASAIEQMSPTAPLETLDHRDVSSADLVLGDHVVVSAGEVIPGDG